MQKNVVFPSGFLCNSLCIQRGYYLGHFKNVKGYTMYMSSSRV